MLQETGLPGKPVFSTAVDANIGLGLGTVEG